MKYPLVRDLAGDGFPATVTCRIRKFSPQGYYQWLAHPVTPRDLVDA
jgi:putative transposase